METQHSVPSPSLHDLLMKALKFHSTDVQGTKELSRMSQHSDLVLRFILPNFQPATTHPFCCVRLF